MTRMMTRVLFSLTLLWIPSAARPQVRVKIGAPAPPLTLRAVLQAPAGTQGKLEELAGRPVVVEFWATWCGPCVDNIPHLNELAETYSGRAVQFISITDETDSDLVERFLKGHPIRGWVGFDKDASTFKRYGMGGRPQTVLISSTGVVRGLAHPVSVTPQVLDDLLGDKPLNITEPQMPPTLGLESGAPSPLVQVLIRPAAPPAISGSSPGGRVEHQGRYDAYGETLRQILADAYYVPEVRVEAPEWCDQVRYDLSVVTPQHEEKTRWELVTQMLQAAFHAQTHKEVRETPVYVLKRIPGREPNLKPALSEGSVHTNIQNGSLEVIDATTRAIVRVASLLLNSEVLDDTALTGQYDFDLNWNPQDSSSLMQAIHEQLGLDLAAERRNLEHLVVDSIQQPATW